MRKQVVEFLHAVTYLRGKFGLSLFSFFPRERKNELSDDDDKKISPLSNSLLVPLVVVNILVILVKLVFG